MNWLMIVALVVMFIVCSACIFLLPLAAFMGFVPFLKLMTQENEDSAERKTQDLP